jgi:hypothetical protein
VDLGVLIVSEDFETASFIYHACGVGFYIAISKEYSCFELFREDLFYKYYNEDVMVFGN